MFWISGAILSNVCVAACLFRQPSELSVDSKGNPNAVRSTNVTFDEVNQMPIESNEKEKDKKINKIKCNDLNLNFSLFKRPLFTTTVLSFMCSDFGFAGSLILIPANVKSLGYDKTYVALSVTIFGGVEVVARILMGCFADLNFLKRRYIYAINMFIGGIFSLVTPIFDSFYFMAVYAAIIATFPGSFVALISVLIIDVVGLENFSPAFGLVSLSFAVANIPSQSAVGNTCLLDKITINYK